MKRGAGAIMAIVARHAVVATLPFLAPRSTIGQISTWRSEMPDLSKGMTDQKLSEIFGWLKRGELALPELQRPSVWGDAKIPRLLESVYHDYPFGVMLIWTPEAGSQIVCRDFEFEEERDNGTSRAARHYLIDGQQRLTSFYRSLYEAGNPPRDWTVHVAFNVRDEEFLLIDGKIKSMLPNPREHAWYRLRALLKMGPDEIALLRREQNQIDLDDDRFQAIFGANGRLWRLLPQNISIGLYNIHERSYGDVVEIFERINQGTPVKESQIVLGKLSKFDPGIVAKVEGYLAESRVKHGRGFDLDFFMVTLAVLVRGSAEMGPLPGHYEWKQKEDVDKMRSAVQADVQRTKTAIDRALRFMDDRLKMDTMKYIRSPRTMTCLAYLLEEFETCRGDQIESRHTAYWLAQSILIGYHRDQARFKQDIAAIRDWDSAPLDDFRKNLRRQSVEAELNSAYKQLDDMKCPISRGDTLFSFVYALLRWKGAVSFPSMRPIQAIRVYEISDDEEADSERKITAGMILHEHHIYPAARLSNELDVSDDLWFDKPWINDIANITFILGDDNFGLGDSAIEYLDDVDAGTRTQHMIGSKRYRTGDYKAFLTDRRKMIKKALVDYLDFLRLKTGA
ncbi:MAG TPA: DUF262 domain-containing protein [Tepidisphaeraceae bacterium]|nr:DUF262 domain-containing protein [Tepidisphaeraceae bacterium]